MTNYKKTKHNGEEGIVLVVCIMLLLMLSLLGVASITNTKNEMDVAGNYMESVEAFYSADAGAERAMAMLEDNIGWRQGFADQTLGNAIYNVTVADSVSIPSLEDKLQVTAIGQCHEARRGVEVVLGPSRPHDLYNYAIYAGNFDEYDPDADSQAWAATLNLGGTGRSADVVNGNVFFNGNVSSTGNASVNGSIEAAGDITGNAPTGSASSDVEYLEPPDLASMNYETMANYVVSTSSPWNGSGYISAGDPRHIFVNDFRNDLAGSRGFTFDNHNFFLGDPYEGTDLTEISVSQEGNRKVYFVDGNLWIEPQGTVSQLINGPIGGTQITIVVKGNIYFCDQFNYNNSGTDGIAFIAMTDGESYTDQNGNNQYDSGEPLLHDDGDGIYDGPREGSGNVCFGDPNGGPLGVVSGFIYADNNFQDHVLTGRNGTPQTFGVNGLLSAGNLFQINRDYARGHAPMTINYDDRLFRGVLDLPGLPRSNNQGTLVVYSWREL
jgi:hypothetical protein